MSSIGLLGISAKPFHSGHFSLIQKAAQENDALILFVSLSDRIRPNEVPISGRDMAEIWKTHISHIIPSNVSLVYLVSESPIRRIYKTLGSVDPNGNDTFHVYGDPDDIANNFNEQAVQKYLGNLYNNSRLYFKSIPRTDTVDISGTKMRQWLEDGNMIDFIKHLPFGVDGQTIWKILRKRVEKSILNSLVKN